MVDDASVRSAMKLAAKAMAYVYFGAPTHGGCGSKGGSGRVTGEGRVRSASAEAERVQGDARQGAGGGRVGGGLDKGKRQAVTISA